jgi:hypothetical protein
MNKGEPLPEPTVQGLRRQGWTVRKCASHEEMQRLHVADWQAVSPEMRANAAWEMVLEAWRMQSRPLDELRFQRRLTLPS